MDLVYFTLVALALYFGADWLLDRSERARGARFENRQVVVFVILLPLALAAIGVYAVFSFGVAERTCEVGLRLALGAQPREVFRMVATTGVRLAAAGISAGLLLALGLSRLIASQLYQVTPTDPVALAAGSALLFLVMLAATLIPALRVARVDPMAALREE